MYTQGKAVYKRESKLPESSIAEVVMKRKAAIVGCGGIARVHARALEALDGVELCAFVDCRTERAAEFAACYGGGRAKTYGDLEGMLAAERPDVVHICTPHYLHVPMALKVLESGGAVFMEKPPAISGQQFAELKRAAGNKERVGICFQNRYNAAVRKVDELLEGGTLGEVKGGRAFVTWCREAEYYQGSDWRGRQETEGGGALINQAIHTLDLLLRWLGEPDRVEASMSNHHLQGVIEVEDMAEAFLQFPGGRRACFYATTAYVSDAPILIELACEKGSIRLEEEKVTVRFRQGDEAVYTYQRGQAEGKAYWGSGHAACICDFYQCLERGTPFANNLQSVENTLRVMMQIYESAGRKGEEK